MVLRWLHNCKLFLASAIVSFMHNCVVCDMLCFSQDARFDLNLLSLFQEGHLSAHQGHLYHQEKVKPFWILMYGACCLVKATNLQSNSVSKNWNLNWKKKTAATYLRKECSRKTLGKHSTHLRFHPSTKFDATRLKRILPLFRLAYIYAVIFTEHNRMVACLNHPLQSLDSDVRPWFSFCLN